MSHDELVQKAAAWLKRDVGCGVVLTELVTCSSSGEVPDAIGFKSGGLSVLVECKTSITDFYADKKKRFRINSAQGMGLYRFMLCPYGMIKPEQLSNGWGLLYVEGSRVLRMLGGPRGNQWNTPDDGRFFPERNIQGEWQLLYSALRRKT